PSGSFRAPLYSTGEGKVTLVEHASPSVSPGDSEFENQLFVRNPIDQLTRTFLHLLKGSVRVSVNQEVKSGQPVAETCRDWRSSSGAIPHHHFAMGHDPISGLNGVTVPSAFSDYEVRQADGTWKLVAKGIPKQGEVIRRHAPMAAWENIGKANQVVAM